MKILYIHNTPIPTHEASSVNVLNMCDCFAGFGHRVSLMFISAGSGQPGFEEIKRAYGLKHQIRTLPIHLPKMPLRERYMALRAALHARAGGIDIVYARKPSLLVPSARMGVDVVLELHGPIAISGRRADQSITSLLRSGRLRRIIATTNNLRNNLIESRPELAEWVSVAQNGANPAEALPRRNPEVSAATRPCVGYSGHLYPGKGMEVIAKLIPRCPEIDFLVVGGLPADITMWRSELGNQANVRFTGHVPPAQVQSLLNECEVMLAPYQRKVLVSDRKTDHAAWMCPLKIFEYMAQGKAIIASDLPLLREILTPDVTAVLLPPEDVDAWADALRFLCADAGARQKLADNARRKLETELTWCRRAEKILNLIKR